MLCLICVSLNINAEKLLQSGAAVKEPFVQQLLAHADLPYDEGFPAPVDEFQPRFKSAGNS